MAGLSIMALGPYQFEALGFGFNARSRTQKTPWAAIPVAGGMDRSQWTGGESRVETISGAVFEEFGGMEALEGLKLAARLGTALPFVDLSGGLSNVFGFHVVEEISEEASVFDVSGRALKTAYTIKLRAYEGAPSSDPLSVISLLF